MATVTRRATAILVVLILVFFMFVSLFAMNKAEQGVFPGFIGLLATITFVVDMAAFIGTVMLWEYIWREPSAR
jgi:hypothetical protein